MNGTKLIGGVLVFAVIAAAGFAVFTGLGPAPGGAVDGGSPDGTARDGCRHRLEALRRPPVRAGT
mgnify:CR=1 FL=1